MINYSALESHFQVLVSQTIAMEQPNLIESPLFYIRLPRRKNFQNIGFHNKVARKLIQTLNTRCVRSGSQRRQTTREDVNGCAYLIIFIGHWQLLLAMDWPVGGPLSRLSTTRDLFQYGIIMHSPSSEPTRFDILSCIVMVVSTSTWIRCATIQSQFTTSDRPRSKSTLYLNQLNPLASQIAS